MMGELLCCWGDYWYNVAFSELYFMCQFQSIFRSAVIKERTHNFIYIFDKLWCWVFHYRHDIWENFSDRFRMLSFSICLVDSFNEVEQVENFNVTTV